MTGQCELIIGSRQPLMGRFRKCHKRSRLDGANSHEPAHRRLSFVRFFVRRKWVGIAILVGFAALNGAAYRQARAFTHFAGPGHRTRAQFLSFGERVEVLVTGVEVPPVAELSIELGVRVPASLDDRPGQVLRGHG